MLQQKINEMSSEICKLSWTYPLKHQEKNASENVVCWSCLLQLIS